MSDRTAPGTLDWVIVGGGIHGTHLSHLLVTRGGVPRDRLLVVDPHPAPIAAFAGMAASIGYRFLRSPSVHHLDLDPYALRTFIAASRVPKHEAYTPPYDRPALSCFLAHTAAVVRAHRLDRLRRRTRVERIARRTRGFAVDTTAGVLTTRRVLLAMGAGEHLLWPGWAQPLRESGRIRHTLDWTAPRPPAHGSLAVIGGGITAAQVACREAGAGRHVHLIRRHPARVHQFDAPPAWLGAKAMQPFLDVRDFAERRRLIASARHRGSMPPEVAQEVRRLVRRGRLTEHEAEVASGCVTDEGVSLVCDDGTVVDVSAVVLATGMEPSRPGGSLVDALVADGAPVAPCGYPVVSPGLEWEPGLVVTGPLAELELGPTARNIAGARAAGRRIEAAGFYRR